MYSSWTDHAHGIEWTRTGPVTIWQDARNGRYLGATHYYEEPSWLPDSSGALLFEETNGDRSAATARAARGSASPAGATPTGRRRR